MTDARRKFFSAVSEALEGWGVSGGLDARGSLQINTGEDELWLQLEGGTHKALFRAGSDEAFELVVRSRVYTFRRAPAAAQLAALFARADLEGTEIEHIPSTRSVYVVERFEEPPAPEALRNSFVRTTTEAARWLTEVLPTLRRKTV